jgi:predicted CXXCH cytochrome family protein
MSSAAQSVRPRIDPGARLPIELQLVAAANLPPADLVLSLADGWSVVDAGGGAVTSLDGGTVEVHWTVEGLLAGMSLTEPVTVQAPDPLDAAGVPTIRSSIAARIVALDSVPAGPAPSIGPDLSPAPVAQTAALVADPSAAPTVASPTEILAAPLDVLVAPRIVIAHSIGTIIDPRSLAETRLAPDRPLTGVERFKSFRIRFQLRNADLADVSLHPQLEARPVGSDTWQPVGVSDGEGSTEFQLDPGWVPAPDGDGTRPGPEQAAIGPSELALDERDDDTQVPVPGRLIATDLPGLDFALPAESLTEVEFVVEPGASARYGRSYEFRVTDAGEPLPGARIAGVTMQDDPGVRLTPGQHVGLTVDPPDTSSAQTAALVVAAEPATALTAAFTGGAGVQGRVDLSGGASQPRSQPSLSYALAPAPIDQPELDYPLAMKEPVNALSARAWDAPLTSPHGSYASDPSCAACHRAHTGRGPELQSLRGTDGSICFQCHDGSGSNLDTMAQFADGTVPADNATDRAFYRHDSQAATKHTLAKNSEFVGRLNRHAACADCHDGHSSSSGLSVQTTSGWTLPPATAGKTSGVIVSNGDALTPPRFTLTKSPDREYQLCFKCHTGYTTLPSNSGQPLSRYSLDKAYELNPVNAAVVGVSFHPIEAAGTNRTSAMDESLGGTSPYKLWTFASTSTIRCVHCHGDPRKADVENPPPAGSDLAVHSSPYRGLLMQSYQDRVLNEFPDPDKPPTDGYDAADFALCYQCHAEAPFRDTSGKARPDTNFRLHGLHVSDIQGYGNTGTDIDSPGAGGGNAICAECHYRVHGTATKQGGQGTYSRLVNFAPNVTGVGGGALTAGAFDLGAQTCTLTCHTKNHGPKTYAGTGD